MKEWQELGSGKDGSNVWVWVAAPCFVADWL